MQTMLFIDNQTGEVIGAIPLPPCFAPNDAFYTTAGWIGLQALLVEGQVYGSPALLSNGAMLMRAMREAKASMN